MTKDVDRRLLAYIQYDESTEVFIDIVEISRRSTSFHYKGTAWRRPYIAFGNAYCTNAKGKKCRISPLSRHGRPSWVNDALVEVKEAAKERYELWQSKNIKSGN